MMGSPKLTPGIASRLKEQSKGSAKVTSGAQAAADAEVAAWVQLFWQGLHWPNHRKTRTIVSGSVSLVTGKDMFGDTGEPRLGPP